MSRNILLNLHHSCHKQQSGFPLCVCILRNKNEDAYNQLFREVRNAVIIQGNEPTDTFIDFERAAVNAVTNQIAQLQILKFNFNLIYSGCIFIFT